MEREKIIEAAGLLKQLDETFALKATLEAGKHQMRLYALSKGETIDDEVEINDDKIAKAIIHLTITRITDRLIELGATDLQTC